MHAEITHVDTCLPDFFNGSTHTVLAVPVDGATTIGDVLDYIQAESGYDYGWSWSDAQYAAMDLALKALADSVPDKSAFFDSSLEHWTDDGESVYAYFTVQFWDD